MPSVRVASRVVALRLHLLTSPMALPPARTYPIAAADQSSPLSVGPAATFFSWRRSVGMLLAAIVVMYAAATTARVVARKYYLFLPGYLAWTMTPAAASTGPTHLLVLFVDHFEPNRQVSTTEHWMERYTAMASRHRDAAGRPPQHTWFYPGEQFEPDIMRVLKDGVGGGLGEVEFHFHHDFDTAETLRPALQRALDQFGEFGFNRTRDGKTRFAFVHGNFGLDNSNGPFYCGVSTEIGMLRELGAFADFTFPSVYQDSQPAVVNRIYAAKDDERPKSYDRPLPLNALTRGEADLMIFEGPLVFSPTWNLRRLFLELDNGDIHQAMQASPARVDRWVRANVHVPERPEWRFIKMFGHGAETPEDVEAVTGARFDEMLSYMEQRYNDGTEYVLHYVTARQAYNVAMAAADGHSGDPSQYYDYLIPPYLADPRR